MKKSIIIIAIGAVLLGAASSPAQRRPNIVLPYQWFLVIDVEVQLIGEPHTIVPRASIGWAQATDEPDCVRRLSQIGVIAAPGHRLVAVQWPYTRTGELPTFATVAP